MSEDQVQDQDEAPEDGVETSPPEQPKYFIHNTSRSRHNRTQRYAAASHRGMKQHLGGGEHRIVRARALALSEAQFMKHLEEIKGRVKAGLLEVRLADGSKLDVETLEVTPNLPSPPLPNFPLDSIANDKNKGIGEVIPPYVGDDQSSMPAVLPPGKLPAVLEKKAEEDRAALEAKQAEEEAAKKKAEDLDAAEEGALKKAIAESGDDEEVDDDTAPPGDTRDTEVVAGVSSSKGKSRRNK